MRQFRVAMSFVPLAAAALAAQTTSSVPINEFTVPWGREGRPRDPAVAPDGRVFFVGQQASYVARLDPKTGEFKKYAIDSAAHPHNCVVDSRGQVWFSGNANGTLNRLDPATGAVATFTVGEGVRDPHTMVFDKKGNIWFTAQQSNAVGYFDVATSKFRIVKIPLPEGKRSTNPYGIVLDSKGRPWFNLFNTSTIGTLDPVTFELKTYKLANDSTRDRRIGITTDGKLYYTDYVRGRLGRLDPATGKVDEWLLPGGAASLPYGMAVDDQDRIWVAESNPAKPNRLVGFDPKTQKFFSISELKGDKNTIRYMIFDKKTRQLWYGSDAGFIGRADVSGVKVAM
jgi:virginiamycin B lyase